MQTSRLSGCGLSHSGCVSILTMFTPRVRFRHCCTSPYPFPSNPPRYPLTDPSSVQCRKTMARIKYVINERRVAYEGALEIHNKQREKLLDLKDAARAQEEARAAEEARKAEDARRRGPSTEDVAAQSLFETVPSAQAS